MQAEAVTTQEMKAVRNFMLESIGGKSDRTKLVTVYKVRITLGPSQFFDSTRTYKTFASAKTAAKNINSNAAKGKY